MKFIMENWKRYLLEATFADPVHAPPLGPGDTRPPEIKYGSIESDEISTAPPPKAPPETISHGKYQDGKLENGISMHQHRPDLFIYHSSRTNRQFAHPDLIGAIINAAENALHGSENQKMALRDISYKTGGKMPPHVSHQNGLDVDIGFIWTGPNHLRNTAYFVPRKPEQLPGYLKYFDVKRNWEFINSLKGSGKVQRVFLHSLLIKALKKVGPVPWWVRAEDTGHHHHYHVRFHNPRSAKAIS